MGLYHNIPVAEAAPQLASESSSSRLKHFQEALLEEGQAAVVLADEATAALLASETGKTIHDILLTPFAGESEDVDIGRSLLQLGLDSLTVIELRRWVPAHVWVAD